MGFTAVNGMVYPTKEKQLEADRAYHLYKKHQKMHQNLVSRERSRLHHLKKLAQPKEFNSCTPTNPPRPTTSREKRSLNKQKAPKVIKLTPSTCPLNSSHIYVHIQSLYNIYIYTLKKTSLNMALTPAVIIQPVICYVANACMD